MDALVDRRSANGRVGVEAIVEHLRNQVLHARGAPRLQEADVAEVGLRDGQQGHRILVAAVPRLCPVAEGDCRLVVPCHPLAALGTNARSAGAAAVARQLTEALVVGTSVVLVVARHRRRGRRRRRRRQRRCGRVGPCGVNCLSCCRARLALCLGDLLATKSVMRLLPVVRPALSDLVQGGLLLFVRRPPRGLHEGARDTH
mmetsp:Transcript_29196/g.74194  ORF Transcript_29196/g.74194 Transcript_29196/m.74194 type:complete len:201 (-) Transcript_29196:304-906(-)